MSENKTSQTGRDAVEKDAVRCQIVEAAKKRFSHFGYAKTTMAEVAADCCMSPGNLYRFFPGKLDIAEFIASTDYESHLEHLRKIARASEKSVRERLHDLLFEQLRRTYTKLEKDPRAYEMASVIGNERPQFADWKQAQERKLLVQLLTEGASRGELSVEDKEFAAEMIQSATMKFRYPQLWSKSTLAKLERELEGVLNLIVDGLTGRPARESADHHAAA